VDIVGTNMKRRDTFSISRTIYYGVSEIGTPYIRAINTLDGQIAGYLVLTPEEFPLNYTFKGLFKGSKYFIVAHPDWREANLNWLPREGDIVGCYPNSDTL